MPPERSPILELRGITKTFGGVSPVGQICVGAPKLMVLTETALPRTPGRPWPDCW